MDRRVAVGLTAAACVGDAEGTGVGRTGWLRRDWIKYAKTTTKTSTLAVTAISASHGDLEGWRLSEMRLMRGGEVGLSGKGTSHHG